MSQGLSIKVDVGGVPLWRDGVDKAVKRAASMAGRDAIKAARAEGSRRIRERKAMKVSAVGKALVTTSYKERLIWQVRASGALMPVAAFPYRQTKKGVSVLINTGKRTLIRGAFEARMSSGHVGIFVRKGKARLPIKEAFTSKVSEAFSDSMPAIASRAEEVFRKTFTRVLPLEADRLNLRRVA